MNNDEIGSENRIPKWYFGGLAATAATIITHPIDLLKVQSQMVMGKRVPVRELINYNLKEKGYIGFYSGLSASLLRQMTYSTTRFAIYALLKENLQPSNMYGDISIAVVGGAVGALVGVPTDLVNVRMQNDIRLPPEKRRKYKHVFHGIKMARKEGRKQIFLGSSITITRGIIVNLSQISLCSHTENTLIETGIFKKHKVTEITATVITGIFATTLTHGFDVLKTRFMNAFPGDYKNITHFVFSTIKRGPTTFIKGYCLAILRIVPQNSLTMLFLQELTKRYGKFVNEL